MDVTVYPYLPSDPVLIDKIVNEFLSQGKFDKLRKECMADADTKPAYQNLQQRVESTVSQFLKNQVWKPDLNRNHLRDSLRKHILESGFLDAGINRIVDQIVNPNVLATVFMPEVEEVVYSYLSIPKPGDKYPKQTDSINKILGNTSSKLSENLNLTLLDSAKDQNILKSEETSPVSDDSKIETCEINDAKTPETFLTTDTGEEVENGPKEIESEVKYDDNIVTLQFGNFRMKEEEKSDVMTLGGNNSNNKIDTPSDESQESLSRMGVERLQICESDGVNAPDSDASLPLEINEKSSNSRDSEDFIINKMSPISQGRLTPDEITSAVEEGKKPHTFIGRIPKLKRDDSESSKSSKKEEKAERLCVKGVYSSDESDSSKQSLGKSDSEDKKLKEAKLKVDGPRDKSEKKYKESDDKRRKSDHHRSHSKDRKSRDDKSRSSRDEKDKSHSRSKDSKSREKERKSSSHSRSKSSSHHKSVHKHDREHHRDDSKSRDKDRSRHDKRERDKRDADRKRRENEKKKKSKSVDDHGRERYRKDDRRSTDRDSNERDRGKDGSSNRIHSEGKRREKEQKVDDSRKGRNQKEESGEKESCVKEAKETLWSERKNKLEVDEETARQSVALRDAAVSEEVSQENCLDVKTLAKEGALTAVKFPEVADDYYVKFGSTGFQYFEEWEATKLDCEEEFKQFIDEADKDLSLLSDDGSDYESSYDHKINEARRKEIVSNSILGYTNFEDGLIFDPVSCEFYKWTNSKFYEKYVGKRNSTPEETDEVSNNVKITDEYETGEKNKENCGREKKVRKNLKLLNRYQRKIGLKLKYGKEQHRFVRRRKKRSWVTDANGFKIRLWNNGNPEGSESFCKSEVNNDSNYVETSRAMVLDSPAEEVLQQCRVLSNHDESSGDTSVDGSFYDDGKSEETLSDKWRIDESSNHSSTSAPKMDVEAKIRLYQIQSLRRNKRDSCPQKTCILARISSGSKADVEYEEGSDSVSNSDLAMPHLVKKIKKRRIRIGLSKAMLKRDVEIAVKNVDAQKNYNLPLSPESDDFTLINNGEIQKKNPRKRTGDDNSVSVSTEIPGKKLKEKRIIRQTYDSQDLYKPRPFSIGSKSRGRALKTEDNNFSKIESEEK